MLVLALACARTPSPQTENLGTALRGLDFEGDLEVVARSPVRIEAKVRIENRRPTPVTLAFPIQCVGLLRAYADDGSRAPVWEQAPGEGCPRMATPVELLPGGERQIEIPQVTADEILGEDLPEGDYRFTVVLEPGDQVIEIDVGEVELERSS